MAPAASPSISRAIGIAGTPLDVYLAVEQFIKTAQQPALLEPGGPTLLLNDGNFSVEIRNSHVLLQAWDGERNLARRIVRVGQYTRGKLSLVIEKFGRREGELFLLDLADPRTEPWERRGSRMMFRERFRLFLAREFSGCNMRGLSCEADLEHSLSPAFPRALLTRGRTGLAAIGAAPDTSDAAAMLTFGLIWLDYLRRREPRLSIEGLVLLAPRGQEQATSLRLPFLGSARFEMFTYAADDFATRLDPKDYGNLETVLHPCRGTAPGAPALDSLRDVPGFEYLEKSDGSASLRINGLEFARMAGNQIRYGLDHRVPAQLSEVEDLARELSRMRHAGSDDRENALYKRAPELWLESQVRSNPEIVDASLLRAPIYGQVPAFSGGERGVIDLLAADRSGRLAVVELKASPDIHLPLQALDYWMRVKRHIDRGEFSGLGYFPGLPLGTEAPRLLLVAPALEFHPTTESILRYFSPEVPVERIAVGANWRAELRVMFRGCGGVTT
jgi:hypothetical protein